MQFGDIQGSDGGMNGLLNYCRVGPVCLFRKPIWSDMMMPPTYSWVARWSGGNGVHDGTGNGWDSQYSVRLTLRFFCLA